MKPPFTSRALLAVILSRPGVAFRAIDPSRFAHVHIDKPALLAVLGNFWPPIVFPFWIHL